MSHAVKLRNLASTWTSGARSFLGGNGDGVAGKILRGGATSAGVILVSMVVGLLNHVLLSRTLGASDYGRYVILLGWALALSVPAAMGLDGTALRYVPKYFDEGNTRSLRQLTAFITSAQLLGIVMAGAALFALRSWSPSLIANATLSEIGWMVLLIGASIVMGTLSSFFFGIKQVFSAQIYLQGLRPLLTLGATGMVVLIGGDITSEIAIAVTALSAAGALVAQLVHFALVFLRGPARGKPTTDRRQWFSFSGYSMLGAICQQALTQTPVILLGALSTTKEAGQFAVSSRLSSLITVGMSVFGSIVFPMIASAHEQKNRAALVRISLVNARLSTAVAAAAVLFFLVAGRPVLALFGGEFGQAYLVLQVLLCGTFFNAFTGASAALLAMTDRINFTVQAMVVGFVVFLILALTLAPRHGALGAAIAASAGVVISNAIMVWRIRNLLGIDCTALGLKSDLHDRR